IGERFGPSSQAVGRVASWLARGGIRLVEAFPQRTALRAAGAATAVDRLLGIELFDYRDPSGARFHHPRGTPRIPTSLKAVVSGIVGLDNRPVMHASNASRQNQATGDSCLNGQSCLTPPQLNRAYDI